ncbi:MAG TPA: cell division protein FtsX, partial [Hyphomonadaceae bacterium]|nr:cell division protein FtsX [Hyphomonadaceae bacterium]
MKPSGAPLLPREDAREAALFFVVCALCFLAALSGLVARSAYAAADSWTAQVTGQITIRIRGGDADTSRAVGLAAATPGILTARSLSRKESEDLLRPWLGASGVPEDLPLPRLIAAEASPGHAGIADTLGQALSEAGIDATVDDHVVWSDDVRRATDSAGLIAILAVALLGATGVAVIAFATHAT